VPSHSGNHLRFGAQAGLFRAPLRYIVDYGSRHDELREFLERYPQLLLDERRPAAVEKVATGLQCGGDVGVIEGAAEIADDEVGGVDDFMASLEKVGVISFQPQDLGEGV